MKFKTTLVIGMAAFTLKVHADIEYKGSSFKEVSSVIHDLGFTPQSPEAIKELSVYQAGKLPNYPMNMASVFSTKGALEKDAIRTTSERFDYYDRLPKKLHPSGVCVTGVWQIDNNSDYSGYFRHSSQGLFIGRVSVAMEKTDYKSKRGFGFAGKLFPTMNPDTVVETGNFFTVDVLMGQSKQRFLETALTNQPETGFDLSLIGLGLKIAEALKAGDEDPGFRPLTQISTMDEQGAVKTPHWIRIVPDSKLVKNQESDYRNEVLKAVKDNGSLTFHIDISETSKGDRKSSDWTRLGRIVVNEAVASYGCDRRLHFSHPKKN